MTLFVSLFVLLVHTFNVFVSALVGVCAHSASCAHSITLFVRLSLCLHPLAFLFTLYMSLFWYVSNLFVCVNCIFVQLFLSAHCVFFYPPVFLSTVLCAQVSVSDLFVSTLLLLFVPTLGVCVYSRRCLRPLCFCPLCVLLVFLFTLSHTKTLMLFSGTWVIL